MHEDEIEENIEMETNSVCSNTRRQEAPKELLQEKHIAESINDSLDELTHQPHNLIPSK